MSMTLSDLPTPQPPTQSFPSTTNTPSQTAPVKVRKTRPVAKVELNDLPDLLTINEVSTLLRVSPLTIKRWGKRGKLPAIRINSRGDRRYKKQAVLWMLGITEQE